ncbi:MAG: asparagine synthase (glutamine-hydrolyzing) [Gammaproteobacteria bacterium]|nr:asparagine synthase (glutamine-hydrolyzing) [Gammaproteobacteria bacterium]
MCGIAGFLSPDFFNEHGRAEVIVSAMRDSIRYRGPDDAGSWVDEDAHVALGHRRLSILDLSPAGHQPMVSADGRLVIAYNGEIYNHAELRAELIAGGYQPRSTSDTEVILEYFARHGITATLARLHGMFAIALWDRETRELTLIRDRLGIKPLYWSLQGRLFSFASELKALRNHPGFRPRLNRDAVATFLRHGYITGPHSIYQDTFKLEPGTLLRYRSGGTVLVERYWDLADAVATGTAARGAFQDRGLEELHSLLLDSVSRHMVADVPLGALLSGGIDSTLVTALMQASSSRPVKTFTIGFNEAGFDEAPYARDIARHLGTEHHELYVDTAHAQEIIPRLTEWYDEPFSDSSQIPTYLVSEMTRRHVTVVLSGDGGDELFTGYTRYVDGARLWRRATVLPAFARRGLSRALLATPEALWDRLFGLVPRKWRPSQAGYKVHKVARSFDRSGPDDMYIQMLSHWQAPDAMVNGGHEPKGVLWDRSLISRIPDFIDRMQYIDTVTYLPDDILTKVDRASMAVSLEARVPLLDHRVVEYAWRLPQEIKLRNGRGKLALRQILAQYVPPPLTERPKMGFGVPIDIWLRNGLRDWAETLLDRRHLQSQGLLDSAVVHQRWDAHQAGENWAYPLWNVLMLQDWLQRYPCDDD